MGYRLNCLDEPVFMAVPKPMPNQAASQTLSLGYQQVFGNSEFFFRVFSLISVGKNDELIKFLLKFCVGKSVN